MSSQDKAKGVLVEAEMFDNYGGWELDSQFISSMGSSYLIAHGCGDVVADATTSVDIPAGEYDVWVRAKDWVPEYHPGRFQVLVNDEALPVEFGANHQDWNWQNGGTVKLDGGKVKVALHDLTSWDGRCDAIWFAPVGAELPAGEFGLHIDQAWRDELLGNPAEPVDKGTFDFIVVGGGCAGLGAALAAGRNGLKTALINDRPVLGGNASPEIGLMPRGYDAPAVKVMGGREADGDLTITKMIEKLDTVTVFANERLIEANMDGDKIASIVTQNIVTGAKSIYSAPEYCDASGFAALGYAAGAEIRTYREGKAEFNEPSAPNEPDLMHHGNTLIYHVEMADHPVDYSNIPWATDVSKDFGSLDGAMGELGEENQYGPKVFEETPEDEAAIRAENDRIMFDSMDKYNMWPPYEVINIGHRTHFWEYGQYMDMRVPGNEEFIRDHLLRALYGTMHNVKAAHPEKYRNLTFGWIHLNAARGEYCRIVGDYMLNENEVKGHADLFDNVCYNDQAFCQHFPGNTKYDFRIKKWVWDARDHKPYAIPFGCLYSKNISNMMMAGKHISVSRVVSTSVKMMTNGINHGLATGNAAALCKKYNCTPREVRNEHIDELKKMVEDMAEHEA
ncbi:MAG: FAD-dependent oxidoreductase [Coriobacteriales bacterium]